MLTSWWGESLRMMNHCLMISRWKQLVCPGINKEYLCNNQIWPWAGLGPTARGLTGRDGHMMASMGEPIIMIEIRRRQRWLSTDPVLSLTLINECLSQLWCLHLDHIVSQCSDSTLGILQFVANVSASIVTWLVYVYFRKYTTITEILYFLFIHYSFDPFEPKIGKTCEYICNC